MGLLLRWVDFRARKSRKLCKGVKGGGVRDVGDGRLQSPPSRLGSLACEGSKGCSAPWRGSEERDFASEMVSTAVAFSRVEVRKSETKPPGYLSRNRLYSIVREVEQNASCDITESIDSLGSFSDTQMRWKCARIEGRIEKTG